MSGTMLLHRGAFQASEADIAAVPIPEGTESYCPVPHVELINRVREMLPKFELTEEKSQFALGNQGQRMFGVIHTKHSSPVFEGVALSVGMRSSYDRSIALTLLGGQHVWICDNLSFDADVIMTRKHTPNVWDSVNYLVFSMLEKIVGDFPKNMAFFAQMETTKLERAFVDHLLMESVRRRAIPFTKLPQVDEVYTKGELPMKDGRSFHDVFNQGTAWRLFNAFTEVHKSRHPAQLQEESKRLFRLFREYVQPDPAADMN